MRRGSAAIAAGSDGRMKAGSTTTAGAPEAANRAVPGERVVAVELPPELEPGEREGAVRELPHRVQAARAEDVVAVGGSLVGDVPHLGLAEDRDHPVDVVGRKAPVALRLQVAERERAVRPSPRAAPARGRPPSARGTATRGAGTRG